MTDRKKQLQIFMVSKDEKLFSYHLIDCFKNIKFLDNNVWEKEPSVVHRIDECKTNFCYIWNKELLPNLPTIERKDGKIQGPASGIVIQFQRCRVDENGNLLSGRIAVGYDEANKEFNDFVKNVWKILINTTKTGVYHISLSGHIDRSTIIKEYVVGKEVVEAIAKGNIVKLKDRSTENYYIPVD